MDRQLLTFKKKYNTQIEEKEKINKILSNIRIIIFLIFITLLIACRNDLSNIKFLLIFLAISFIIVAICHKKVKEDKKRLSIGLDIIRKYESRSNNKWKEKDDETLTIIPSKNSADFMIDLDIIGKSSLFQFLNFTKSKGGAQNLLDVMSLENVTKDNILANQEAIEELKNNFNFILSFQEEMSEIEDIENIDFKEYLYLFKGKKENKKTELIVSCLISLVTIITFVLTIQNVIKPYFFLGLFFLQIISSHLYTFIYNNEFSTISKCAKKFSKLQKVYDYIKNQNFESKKNKNLQHNIIEGRKTLKRLIDISSYDSCRYNFVTNTIFNVFFSLDFIILYKYMNLLNKESKSFETSIKAIEELETLISLSTVCLVKEKTCKPIVKDNLCINISNMKHPLLDENDCISNSFECERDINIITGSNMSGKTSFMKTIGTNLVLAYTGTFVNAESFSCSIMKMFTSINVKDDINNGISTFYGELQRIKKVLEFSKKSKEPIIVFIDEIFKGTNYNDRILGAKETLKKLSMINCIVFLTTHDFELCEISNKKVHNYHFAEFYKENKIFFDYKIKTGKCTTTNAKYLMKKMRIID